MGALASSTSSSGTRAVASRRSGLSLNAETRRGNHTVAITTGMNMSVWKSRIGAPYQPTCSAFVISESMIVSIQR